MLRGNDAGRGKPRLYKVSTGPFAPLWVCKDSISGLVGYGHLWDDSDETAARGRAYDQWDIRSSTTREFRLPHDSARWTAWLEADVLTHRTGL